jgi:hypothetical protein
MKPHHACRIVAMVLTAIAVPEGFCQTIVLPKSLTVDETTYTGVVYQRHDASRLEITHDNGLASIKIRSLPEELRRLLGYDADAAMAAEEAASAARKAAVERQLETIARHAFNRERQELEAEVDRLERPIEARIFQVFHDGILIRSKVQTIGLVHRSVSSGNLLHPNQTKVIQEQGVVDAFLSSNPRGKVFIRTQQKDLVDGGTYSATVYPIGTYIYNTFEGIVSTVPRFTDSRAEALEYHEKQRAAAADDN